ncbi:transmembrane protein, putative [Rhizoctonia solani AG-3 Rhs1AP]|uniref:Transmembrane protein, putative n=1 Tax=Rhizoctonia solani AG-3 Rhs1AP TaxID=1086054 RepID=X8J593_9AGAM|nr:transmembrane protein, putative [Rhizoctonia solani AG-3 Rhs1AP]
MVFRIPSLEYSLSHPHPKGRVFLIATVVIFLFTLPVLVLVNLITQGSELVPSLQTQYQPNDTLLEGWWGTHRLPSFFRPKTPRCQPKDIGRGDTFRLTTSLFDYTVMSTLNTSGHNGVAQLDEQIRAEYRGQDFSSCYVNSARFDYNMFDQTQSVMVGVFCPGFPYSPVNVSMQTTMTFAWELSKDFIGQYYGPGLDLLSLNETNPSDYRKVVLAVLEVISTDSLSIMHRPHLSNPAGSIRIAFKVNATTGVWKDDASTLTYVNGTQLEAYPAEANIYGASIANLVTVAMDAVSLDLGSTRFPNVFRNFTYMSKAIKLNLAPVGINSTNWAEGSRTFYYGALTKYETWADTLLHGEPVKVGDLTGLPARGSTMATTYLCPTYQVKPMGSFLSSVFVGSATMTLSVWGVWMFFTAFVAKRIMAPRVECQCASCHKRRVKEAGDKCECGECHQRREKETGVTCGCEHCDKRKEVEREKE